MTNRNGKVLNAGFTNNVDAKSLSSADSQKYINTFNNKGRIMNAVFSKASNKVNIAKILPDSLPDHVKNRTAKYYYNDYKLDSKELQKLKDNYPDYGSQFDKVFQLLSQNNNHHVSNNSTSKNLTYTA